MPSLAKNVQVCARVDDSTLEAVDALARLWGVSRSEALRRAIMIAVIVSDPTLTLGSALKPRYAEMVKEDPEGLLKVPLSDALRPVHQLFEEVTR